MLLAFIGLIALFNVMLGGIGGWFGHGDLSLQMVLGWKGEPPEWREPFGFDPGRI